MLRTLVHRILPAAVGAALALAPSAVRAQQLSPEERRIAAYVDAHADDAIALLERTVNVNSGTHNLAGVRQVGDIFRAQLDSLGFETRWVELPDSLHRAGHLFAELRGRRGKRVLVIGHLDTVFEPGSPFQRFVRSGPTASGPGSNDMKGGDVIAIYALRALRAAGVLRDRRIIVAFTGDEEAPGRPLSVARAELIEAGRRSDAALEFEGASREEDGTETVVTSRRSSSGWTLSVRARPAHSSGIFAEGVGSGAIYEAARVLDAFQSTLREPGLTFSPGMILGGTEVQLDTGQSRGTAFGKSNVIAATAIATGDIRTLTDEQLQRTRERMRQVLATPLAGAQSSITFSDGYPSMPPTPGNLEILGVLNGVNRSLGLAAAAPNDPGRRGAGDISFVAPYVSGIGGLGAHGTGSHTERETVNLETLPQQIKRAALLIYRLTR
ncbi:M20/M25/M40 family metallo-hydrolase [Longimicrobium sp.]|uniref:M20/M25/M40 family metallo-hydrolase n=1 Tax=Longimicrobium sp. TaxID=2029185 RepID=UPI002CA4595E|nr:M20/M25/M40 family metallo-hydrolase [Longimicrobium sp.]HSU14258.1 M20/M25/M40 family metallo-hydrolase [Longimicrobium sp.]